MDGRSYMENCLKTNNLTKTYGEATVVNKVNITVKKGDIYGLIGRNGAGKSTLMKMVGGLVKPTSGDFKLFDGESGIKVAGRIGCMIEDPALYPDMSARDNLLYYNKLLGITDNSNIDEILELVGLENVGKKKTKAFSLGMKQRLSIGIALMGYPDFLLLDEPVNGLDPAGIVEIRNLILKLNRERNITILISSHILEELSKVATRYGIIDKGRLVEEFTTEELNEKCRKCIVVKSFDIKKTAYILENEFGSLEFKITDETTICVYDKVDELPKLNKMLVNADIDVQGIYVQGQNLESYFMERMGGSDNE